MTRRAVGHGAVAAMAAVAVLVPAAACGVDDGATTELVLPLVAEIDPAIAAVERELGGPQRYVEVNATTRLVNLFVVDDGSGEASSGDSSEDGSGDGSGAGDSVVPYLYVDGELQPPAPAVPVEDMGSFVAADVTFDPDTVLDGVIDGLPTSAFGLFVVSAGPDGDVRYEVLARSTQGGALAVAVTTDGTVLGVEATGPD